MKKIYTSTIIISSLALGLSGTLNQENIQSRKTHKITKQELKSNYYSTQLTDDFEHEALVVGNSWKQSTKKEAVTVDTQEIMEETEAETETISYTQEAPSENPEEILEEIPEPVEVITPEPEVVPEVEENVAPVVSQPTWLANTMYVAGISIPYQNAGESSGQGVIDSNPNMIATWGGAAVQSGNDGANTHFIGHNPGIFSVLFSLGGGSEVIVTDSSGTPTYYYVYQIVQVDDYATRMDSGVNIADEVIGSGGGERISLQTCITDDINLIVMASVN